MNRRKKNQGSVRGFFKGVFWTTWIGMAVFIALPHIKPIEAYTTPEMQVDMAKAMTQAEEDKILAKATMDVSDLGYLPPVACKGGKC